MQGHRIKTIVEEFNLILPRFIEKLESATIGFKKDWFLMSNNKKLYLNISLL